MAVKYSFTWLHKRTRWCRSSGLTLSVFELRRIYEVLRLWHDLDYKFENSSFLNFAWDQQLRSKKLSIVYYKYWELNIPKWKIQKWNSWLYTPEYSDSNDNCIVAIQAERDSNYNEIFAFYHFFFSRKTTEFFSKTFICSFHKCTKF